MSQKEELYKKIVQENEGRIRNICRHYGNNASTAEDIYQEIAMNIWKSLKSFRGDSHINTWIYRIATNTAITYSAKELKKMNFNLSIDRVQVPELIDNDVTDKLHMEKQLETVNLTVNNLSVIEKLLITLMLEGLTSKEMAEVIGITEPNVRTKIHRIKDQLRKTLNSENNEII